LDLKTRKSLKAIYYTIHSEGLEKKASVTLRPSLHQESRPIFNPNQAFFVGATFEISPQGLYTKRQG
jgi:hypothetical protein